MLKRFKKLQGPAEGIVSKMKTLMVVHVCTEGVYESRVSRKCRGKKSSHDNDNDTRKPHSI